MSMAAQLRSFALLAAATALAGCILVPPQVACGPLTAASTGPTGALGSPGAPGGTAAGAGPGPGGAVGGSSGTGGGTIGNGSGGAGGAGGSGGGTGGTPAVTPTPAPAVTASPAPLASARVRVATGQAGDPRTVTLSAATDVLQLSASATDAGGRPQAVVGWRVEPLEGGASVFVVDPAGRLTVAVPPLPGTRARARVRAVGADGTASADEDAVLVELTLPAP